MSTQAHGTSGWNRRKTGGRRREDLGLDAPRDWKSIIRYAVFSLAYRHSGVPVLERRKGPRRRVDKGASSQD